MQEAEDVSELQEAIKPYLLRRMKEDVEKAVPPKEEIIIEVGVFHVEGLVALKILDLLPSQGWCQHRSDLQPAGELSACAMPVRMFRSCTGCVSAQKEDIRYRPLVACPLTDFIWRNVPSPKERVEPIG